LTAVGAQARRAQGQQQSRSIRAIAGFNERDRDSGPLQRRRRLAGRQARECRATLCNIPPGGIIKWLDHPA
jgi:hypothetical protein